MHVCLFVLRHMYVYSYKVRLQRVVGVFSRLYQKSKIETISSHYYTSIVHDEVAGVCVLADFRALVQVVFQYIVVFNIDFCNKISLFH